MNDIVDVYPSSRVKLIDPKLIKKNMMLRTLIRSFYPVWFNNISIRVLRNGRIYDKELFRAVLAGHQIDLQKTV